jgi:LysR family transcriptional regulator, cyn operon transcriptional activator
MWLARVGKMELRHIRYFLRAGELLHFTHAAESLYVSQPTLSLHIHQLEEELGTPLFIREGRRVRLTEGGELFLEHARRIIRELELADQNLADLKGLERGTLRIGSLLTFGQEILPDWVAGFHANYPKIAISVTTGSSSFLEDQLKSNLLDVVFSFLPANIDDVQEEPIVAEEVFLLVSKQHEFAAKRSIQAKELERIPLALVGRNLSARHVYDRFFAEHKVNPEVLIEFDDLRALLKIVKNGDVATLTTKLAAGDQRDLRFIPIADEKLLVNYGMLWLANSRPSLPAKAFLNHVKTQRTTTLNDSG